MKPKQARKLCALIYVALGISTILCIVMDGTFWLFVMLGLALAGLYVAAEVCHCPHCGKKLRLAPTRFCPHCGAKLDDDAEEESTHNSK